jgi:hypothetical protein
MDQVHNVNEKLSEFSQQHMLEKINTIRRTHNINDPDTILETTISLDGTWKKRGHCSDYGIVFAIDVDSGWCIDYEILSLRCEACEQQKMQKTTIQFQVWFKDHAPTCSKNYDGTPKGMEAEGARRIFERSLTRRLQYKYLVCDGDSSAYERVKNIYIDNEDVDGKENFDPIGKLLD